MELSDVCRRTPSTEIEQALVSATFRLLEEEGPEALSVRRISAAAGVAPMGVYNHFEGGKNGLIDAVFRNGFALLAAELTELAARTAGDPPADFLREGLRHYRRLALEHPRVYQVMFFCSIPGFEPTEDSLLVADEAFAVLVSAIERGMGQGSFSTADPRSVAQQVWAACHGAVALEIAGIGKVDDPEATYEALVTTLLRGISEPGSLAPAG